MIYTAKSRSETPVMFNFFPSSMFVFVINSVTWFFHYYFGIPPLFLPCGVRW